MATYAERIAAADDRAERRRAKLTAEADAQARKAMAAIEHIPMGQPILVGHHSERRHRADLERSDRAMRKAAEASDAAGRVSDPTGAVLASDADGIEILREKLASREARQAAMVEANKAARKAGKGPAYEAFQLSNNGAVIRQTKERIARLEKMKAAPPVSREVAGLVIEEAPDDARLRIRFPGKPAPAIIAELKGFGFRWAPTEGAWQAHLSNKARWAADRIVAAVVAAAG